MLIGSNFIVPNGTFIAEFVAFIITLAVVGKYIVPRLNKALTQRQDEIRADLEAADQAREMARAADDERKDVLDQARVRAREIVEHAQHNAERVAEEGHARGEQEYERIISQAEERVRLERQRALEETAQHFGKVVVEVVERIIGREMDAAAHRDLIDEAVSALAAGPGGVAAAGASGAPASSTGAVEP